MRQSHTGEKRALLNPEGGTNAKKRVRYYVSFDHMHEHALLMCGDNVFRVFCVLGNFSRHNVTNIHVGEQRLFGGIARGAYSK